ncbi:MAG TPA: aminoglycoside phosphotransferase family protein [Pirellulales bacterium]|nr:aminoglycoside phosphotransferase family protein [Pirellulales bacterium]
MKIDSPPLLLDEQNTAEYLRARGWIEADEPVEIGRLAGGVSNEVFYVARPSAPDREFVVKQARHQLRTAQPWFSSIERIWREVAVMRACQQALDVAAPADLRARTPAIVAEDRTNYTFAMTAADRAHRVWKRDLLDGVIDASIGRECGRLLGVLHSATWDDEPTRRELGDRTLFDELRMDPYYRSVAAACPEHAGHFERLIASVPENLRSLVHADFTPKNLLVWSDGLMMVDFETGHFGDPAFDLGLFMAHLVLKQVANPAAAVAHRQLKQAFLSAYETTVRPRIGDADYAQLVERGIQHLAGCTWARLDGKSRIEYLEDESRREAVRRACRAILDDRPRQWNDALEVFEFNMDGQRR